jgi:hypothetical protein
MCAAIPLKKIMAPSIVKALVKSISTFRFPRVVQSDIQQVLPIALLLPTTQSLKVLLRDYIRLWSLCWEFTALSLRKTGMKGSLLCCLQHGRFFRSLSALVWMSISKVLAERGWKHLKHTNVSTFRYRLHNACEFASENMEKAQTKINFWYDQIWVI